jgi:hypothetical protein
VIERASVPDLKGEQRGVVAEGLVGTKWAGRFRWFRYEIRCWREGLISDLDEGIASPVRLVNDLVHTRRIIALLPSLPTPVWGRDELNTGEMWNPNSATSWVLVRSRVGLTTVRPPVLGRAPGWGAGVVVADRDFTAQGTDAARK